jgi:hypothetical protein
LYENERKKNEQLNKENENLRRQVLLIPDRFTIDERKSAIIEYIRRHPGTTKIQLITELQNSVDKKSNVKKHGAYVTLHKEIKTLTELNVIRTETLTKQKPNWYLNESSF